MLWGQAGSQGLALGPMPWRSGRLASQLPFLWPPIREHQCQQRWGGDGANWAQPAVPAWTTLGNRKWEGCTQQVRARLKGTAGAGV